MGFNDMGHSVLTNCCESVQAAFGLDKVETIDAVASFEALSNIISTSRSL